MNVKMKDRRGIEREVAIMSRLLDFYRGRGTDTEGRTLAELWAYSDREMEAVHDFIQWMFPLREPSRFNPDAPLLTDADVEAFRSDASLQAAMGRSLGRFLAFLGLKFEAGAVVEADDFERKRAVWTSPNHNWLRITRVLTSARMLGQADAAGAFFRFLDDRTASGEVRADAQTLGYWSAAIRG